MPSQILHGTKLAQNAVALAADIGRMATPLLMSAMCAEDPRAIIGKLLILEERGLFPPYGLVENFDVNLTFWFDLDAERNLTTAFSTFLLTLSAALMAYTSYLYRASLLDFVGWLLFTAVLVFMACDELFQLHESAGRLFGLKAGFGTHLVPAWVQAMAIIVPSICIALAFFWLRLPAGLRFRMLVSAIVFLSGAMGGEILSSAHIMNHGIDNFSYTVLNVVEEGLEMVGVLILIDAMLSHISFRKKRA